MDVERAIEHLLELHARAEARMDRTDRQIEAIQKLMKTGMKLIVRIEAAQARTDAKIDRLADAQTRTDAKIDRLADLWLRRPHNGNGKR